MNVEDQQSEDEPVDNDSRRHRGALGPWKQGTEMAAVLVGFPQIDEAPDLIRAYRARGDSPPLRDEPQQKLRFVDIEL